MKLDLGVRPRFLVLSAATALATLATLAACAGEGSDIGPKLPRLPSASSKFLVLDDQLRGVVDARVSIGGAVALSGRNGRGELFTNPRGRVVVAVDGSNGAAVAGDRLGTVSFASTYAARDLDAVAFLPAFASGATALVNVGTQTSATTITSAASAVLRVPSGSSVGHSGAASSFLLGVGDLAAAHVPGDLPVPTNGNALLTGRVVCIDPPGATFSPGADLQAPDDLAIGAAATTARLFELDATTGEWTQLRSGLAAVSGNIVATGAITRGGTYVFGVEVPATTVSGRIVSARTPVFPVSDALVAVDGRRTRTNGNGDFTVAGVPAQRADASARAARVEVFAGGDWLPVLLATTVNVAAGPGVVTGELTFDTVPAGNVRVQQIRHGRSDPLQPSRISGTFDNVAYTAFSDADGQVTFEDMPAEWFGLQEGRPKNEYEAIYGQTIAYLDFGRRWQDASQFLEDRDWYIGTRRVGVAAVDSIGGGPVNGAAFVVGITPGNGLIGITDESGTYFVDRDCDARATVSVATARDGRSLTHVVTVDHPDAEHLEMPLRRVLRTPVGAFDRHGVVAGTVQGADPSRVHRLRSTRRIELREWFDDVVDGIAIASSLPIDVDPATTHGAFQAGVDRVAGHLAATELSVASSIATLQKVGVLEDIVPVEGETTSRDIALDLLVPATANFTVPQGLTGLHSSIAVPSLRCALALEQSSGRVVDVVRDLGGNHAASGSDLTLRLPPLAGAIANHRWRVLVQGTGSAAGGTVAQRTLLSLRGGGAETAAPFLALPVIQSPAAGAVVSANGFDVTFTLPAGALYAMFELRSTDDTLLWHAYVRPNATTFTFQLLPPESPKALVAGKSYTLKLTAFRASAGPSLGGVFDYRGVTTFLQSIGTTERGVDSLSSHTIAISSS